MPTPLCTNRQFADTACRLQDLSEASKWLKRAVSLDGSRHEPYAMLALRYEQSAQYDKALDYRAKAATLVPPNLRPQAAEAGAQPPADFRCLMLYS